jgi:hypothetical protein
LGQAAPSTPEHVPLEMTIGQAEPDIVPSLIVVNANGASLQGGMLTLNGVAPNSIVFRGPPGTGGRTCAHDAPARGMVAQQ